MLPLKYLELKLAPFSNNVIKVLISLFSMACKSSISSGVSFVVFTLFFINCIFKFIILTYIIINI